MDDQTGHDRGELQPFHELLAVLFALSQRPQPDGRSARWSTSSLARRMTELGYPTSPSLVGELRTGTRLTDPKRSTIHALAQAFEVPVAYFFDPAVTAQVTQALQEAQLRDD